MCCWEAKTYAFNMWCNMTDGIYTLTQGRWCVIEFGAQLTID